MFRVPEITYLKDVLDAAVRVDDALGGLVRLVDDDSSLRIVAHAGMPSELLEAYDGALPGDGTACAQAFVERRRVVIRDVNADQAYEPRRPLAEAVGYRSVQSTPLIDRDRRMLGVLSTYFAEPHHPSTISMSILDQCAAIAVRLVECRYLQDAINEYDRERGIPRRELSTAAAQASDAVRMLLPSLKRQGGHSLLDATERHLTHIVDELTAIYAATKTPA